MAARRARAREGVAMRTALARDGVWSTIASCGRRLRSPLFVAGLGGWALLGCASQYAEEPAAALGSPIPLPERALLSPQPEPACALKAVEPDDGGRGEGRG